jgi:hypothetical protein
MWLVFKNRKGSVSFLSPIEMITINRKMALTGKASDFEPLMAILKKIFTTQIMAPLSLSSKIHLNYKCAQTY